MEPLFFENPEVFRNWMIANHLTASELSVGFYKKGSGEASITWPESVAVALCFGWIDGVRHSIDDKRYKIRFTPRKASSIWSAVNIKMVEELTTKGLMHPSGIAAYEKRSESKSKVYSYETEDTEFPEAYLEKFKQNEAAWNYFEKLANSYKRNSIKYVMTAKQEATRQKRFADLIADCAAGINQWKDNKYAKK